VIVQKVLMPTTDAESWTVVDDDLDPVRPAEEYLAYLSAIERSPTTVRAYAFGLKLWFEFVSFRGLEWDRVGVDAVAQFVAWLRAPADNVIVLDASSAIRSPATVNRHLAAMFGLYDYQARSGVKVAVQLVAWRRVGRGSYKPFLHHVTKGRPIPTRPVKLAVPHQVPRTLTDEQILAVLSACDRLRDRFLLALLAETGMRIGQALGLRHSDFVSRDRQVRIVPRADNANGARAKTRTVHIIPVTAALVRLYSEYLHTEYGDLDSDYVFVNLWAEPRGQALRYSAVADLVARIRARTGIFFTLHMLRHSFATDMENLGVAEYIIQRLLGHASAEMTGRYARMHDSTLREAFDDYCRARVNIAGEVLGFDPEDPTAKAEWVKHRLGRIQASLPNGFCGRPPQQDCPHPNACLTCADFQTTPEFLAIHRQQAENTRILIATAEANGQFRLLANHRRVLDSLEKIIPALEAFEDDGRAS